CARGTGTRAYYFDYW
nr:immunoglobulin heavy chain junction region [Mus musculus]